MTTDLLTADTFVVAAYTSARTAVLLRLDFPNGIHYMRSNYFEWDDTKAEANFKKHKVRFEHAVEACEDHDALIELDDS